MSKLDVKFHSALGKHLKELRERRGWTQVDLSVVARIHESQISRIENGEYSPRTQTVLVLALALGVYPYELLKVDTGLKPNTNFTTPVRKRKKTGTTELIRKLVSDNYFRSPKSVSDIIIFCKREYSVSLSSADTSGVLLRLLNEQILERIPSQTRGRFLYKNAS